MTARRWSGKWANSLVSSYQVVRYSARNSGAAISCSAPFDPTPVLLERRRSGCRSPTIGLLPTPACPREAATTMPRQRSCLDSSCTFGQAALGTFWIPQCCFFPKAIRKHNIWVFHCTCHIYIFKMFAGRTTGKQGWEILHERHNRKGKHIPEMRLSEFLNKTLPSTLKALQYKVKH